MGAVTSKILVVAGLGAGLGLVGLMVARGRRGQVPEEAELQTAWVKQESEDPVDTVRTMLPQLLTVASQLSDGKALLARLQMLQANLKVESWLASHEKPVSKLGTWLLNTGSRGVKWRPILAIEANQRMLSEKLADIEDERWNEPWTMESELTEANEIARVAAGLGKTIKNKW
eukprot:TRINITY_DN16631_c0_g1_i1.p1 TRINITY_DN16631_c0_g1~~TRINITY_DN16631_c0_g1_i1.p1  ORF type:complete len:173 (-),score=23.64 TRINITY_DN16631_c0_g1_i1:224-742(-)